MCVAWCPLHIDVRLCAWITRLVFPVSRGKLFEVLLQLGDILCTRRLQPVRCVFRDVLQSWPLVCARFVNTSGLVGHW